MLPTPQRALIELDERRRRMLAEAPGRSLDLSDERRSALAQHPDGQYDSIVSVLQLSMAPDPALLCATLRELLAPGGVLLFLEPTVRVGAVGVVQRAFGPMMLRMTGRRSDYDIPAIVRGAGLLISDLDRFDVRALWPYRSFVEGVARRPMEEA
jgi:SAM-dependent methyltransferase